jgi:hypothetical protein
MRIVTRPDFDGVVCAVLLFEAETITEPTLWVEPSDMQTGQVDIRPGDIVANLPFDPACALWFDHHYSNKVDLPFKGDFRMAPSAAGIIYRYYQGRFERDYRELVAQTDRIDSADLTRDEVRHPENHPYVLLSMTVGSGEGSDAAYWNRLVRLLLRHPLERVLQDPEVADHCRGVVEQNRAYARMLQAHTRLVGHVSVTDFRDLGQAPAGNRFLVYSMFPEATVSVKIRYDNRDRNLVAVSVGHNIFNPGCRVNAGLLLAGFEGGGHRGAASCRFDKHKADDYIPAIMDALLKNVSNESGG